MKREEAIETVKNNWPEGRLMLQEALQALIPELNESEDERIRKALITFFQRFPNERIVSGRTIVKEAITWLEKQGKQESVGKIEPKFQVGDCISTSTEEPKNNSKFRDGDIVTIVKHNEGWTDYYIGIVIGPYIYGTDLSKVLINKALYFDIRYATENEKHEFLSGWKTPKELSYTDVEAIEFANKVSHEWWQVAMDQWNTLTEDEKKKYNQYIGFNYFSDQLMDILISVLLGLKRNGKLIYEEGSLFSEPEQKPTKIEIDETPIPCYEPKSFYCNGNCGYCYYKTDTGCSRKIEYEKSGTSSSKYNSALITEN